MIRSTFNPVDFMVSLATGWLLLSLMQSAVRSLYSGRWGELIPRFRSIAFFHDGKMAIINIVIIVVTGIITPGIWHLLRQR
ncbi:MAG TPA: hypothetical protein VMX33_00825 [bacterium]|nr:hypothetical protein [bacterium]